MCFCLWPRSSALGRVQKGRRGPRYHRAMCDRPCLPFTPPRTLTSHFGLPLFLFCFALGKVVFLSCHVCGESCVIKCGHIALDFGHFQLPRSLLPCKGWDFSLIHMLSCLTIAGSGGCCSGPPRSHLGTAFSASACSCPLEWPQIPGIWMGPGTACPE